MRAGQKRHSISVRVNAEEEKILQRIARRQKRSVSDVVREAVSLLARQDARTIRPYEEIADLIGIVPDLPAGLSERTGKQFADIVGQKAGQRK